MKNTYKALKLSSTVLLIVLLFVSCDKDFNTIESDVLGKDNANFITDDRSVLITAYNKKLNGLQINNLSSNLLGFFNDPAFGKTTASVVTQITPTTFSPTFGENVAIDSVIVSIPYFSRVDPDNSPDDLGNIVYTIKDSLYGSNPIKLSIYQNNYFLRTFNPDLDVDDAQNYYSMSDAAITGTDNFAITENATINFDTNKGGLIHTVPSFIPSSNSIILTTGSGEDKTSELINPTFRIELDDTDFWKTAIIDKEGDAVLSNANNFNDYFRGLYFKAEAIGGTGNMVFLDFASTSANIIIYYSEDSTANTERVAKTYTLNFTGNRLNTFINDYSLVTLADGDQTLGDEKLYLKGAEGSMAVVDLFGPYVDANGNGVHDGLDDLRAEYIDSSSGQLKLINEAQLIIYEDTPSLNDATDSHIYDRIYAYDANNNIPLIDYNFDTTENTTTPVFSRISHLGQRIERDDNGIFKYKIRITEHLTNLVFNDSTNTKIGLALSSNVNYIANAQILNSTDNVTAVPAASLLTTRGTVLHGTNENVPADRRMKLEIFFTDPDN